MLHHNRTEISIVLLIALAIYLITLYQERKKRKLAKIRKEIDIIIQQRYANYEPQLFKSTEIMHNAIRNIQGDKFFLAILKRLEADPIVGKRPVYELPTELQDTE